MAGPFVVLPSRAVGGFPAEDPGGILKKMAESFGSCKFCVSTHKMHPFAEWLSG